MIDALTAAIASAAASDDWEAVANLLALLDRPEQVSKITGTPVASFVAWTAGTSPATGEPGYISEGGQFRKEKPTGSGDTVSTDPHATRAANVLANAALADVPDEVKTSGFWGKVKDAALTAAAHVYGRLVVATPHLEKAINLFFDATDDPRTDFSKIGYNPTLGTAGHTITDPVKDQLGISAHLATTIASKVLGIALYQFRKRVLGHFQGADEPQDWLTLAAEELAGLINSTNALFGLPDNLADARKIADAMRVRSQSVRAEQMADDRTQSRLAATPTPVVQTRGKAVPSEVALAGADGAAFAKLLGQSKAYGVKVMADVVGNAVRRYRGSGPVLSKDDESRIATALAAVNSTSELLGRTRVRERADRVSVFRGAQIPDVPFSTFADDAPGVLATPEAAVAYFMSRRPELGIDPDRFGALQRRQAFTLAQSSNIFLTSKIQGLIGDAMRKNLGTADAAQMITDALKAAGVHPSNPQYSEMVFRTNAMDSFQQGMWEEGNNEEVRDAFPCWQYLIVDDSRTGDDHRPKGGKYYPNSATFSAVRGPRVFNCRCSLRWVDSHEWHDLQAKGNRVESNW